MSDSDGRMEQFPKLKFSENSTLVDVFIDMTKIRGLKVKQPDRAILGEFYA